MISNERFASMWRKSREDAGKSQEYVARAMGISKKTVQNWESGYSCPDQCQGLEWFHVLGIQPLPYYMEILYPQLEDINPNSSNENLDAVLFDILKDFSADSKRKLLYLFAGNHGSSPSGILEMVIAHLHLPIAQRLNTGHNIITNYQIDKAYGALVEPNEVQPNMALLVQCYENCLSAVQEGKKEYDSIKEEL